MPAMQCNVRVPSMKCCQPMLTDVRGRNVLPTERKHAGRHALVVSALVYGMRVQVTHATT